MTPMRLGGFFKYWTAATVVACGLAARGAPHQTDAVSPLANENALPFRIALRTVDWGDAELPTLHSYAAAQYEGQWVLLGGRTNGLHGFEESGSANFPTESQNRDVWIIDPTTRQTWRRSLDDPSAGLDAAALAALTPTNNQFVQRDQTLYMTGGYGTKGSGGLGTIATLSAIDLQGIVAWAKGGEGYATQSIRQLDDPLFSVTGGAMLDMGGRMHLVFGQDFQGGYTPGKEGDYTRQVRSFDVVDDGVSLAIQNVTTTNPEAAYRRRDLNVFPVVETNPTGQLVEAGVVLSGVFTESFGAWTVPVAIASDGTPSMADPLANDTFKQGFNGYHSAKVGLYSEATGAMHELLFGGISLQFRDPETATIVTDDALPFVNDLTALTIEPTGEYRQTHLGYFPEILDQHGKRLRFGANAEFFVAPGIDQFENGVIRLDPLQAPTTLGYVLGGLAANGPHTRGATDVVSFASNRIFEVVLTPVPEPTCFGLVAALVVVCCRRSMSL